MDFLKKAQDAIGGNSSGQNNQQHNQGQNPQNPNAPQQGGSSNQKDYGDKALDFIEQKTGHRLSDQQNEKITDGVRGFYEKQTGKKVDPKYSN